MKILSTPTPRRWPSATVAPLIDLNIFEIGYRSGSPDQALRSLLLFRGELLEGISDITDAFSHWLTLERTVLRDRFFAAASSLLIELTRYGRASDQDLRAIADQMLALDPEREASYRTLIEAYGRNGMYEDAERDLPGPGDDAGTRIRGAGTAGNHRCPAPRAGRARLSAVLSRQKQQRSLRNRVSPFLAPVWIMQPTASGTSTTGLLTALVEDIANELARYRSFVTLAPHSSFKLQHDSGLPGGQFGAAGGLHGQRLRQAQRTRPVAGPAHGATAAAARFSGPASFPSGLDDLVRSFRMLSLQVASSVAASIERHLMDNMRRDGSNAAYLHYLDGQNLLKNCDLPQLRRARKAFSTAIEPEQGHGTGPCPHRPDTLPRVDFTRRE